MSFGGPNTRKKPNYNPSTSLAAHRSSPLLPRTAVAMLLAYFFHRIYRLHKSTLHKIKSNGRSIDEGRKVWRRAARAATVRDISGIGILGSLEFVISTYHISRRAILAFKSVPLYILAQEAQNTTSNTLRQTPLYRST
jgi:hypothetical protein